MDIPGYLTTDQATARLGITSQTLYNLANSAEDFPKPEKVGRASIWPEAEIDAWRERHPKRNRRRGPAAD